MPVAAGGIGHVFVVYGYLGADRDSEKLCLTDRLLHQAALMEVLVCASGQPVTIASNMPCR